MPLTVLRNTFERGSNEAFQHVALPRWCYGRSSGWLSTDRSRFIIATLIWEACIGMHVLGPLMLAPVAIAVALLAAWRYRTTAPPLALLVGGHGRRPSSGRRCYRNRTTCISSGTLAARMHCPGTILRLSTGDALRRSTTQHADQRHRRSVGLLQTGAVDRSSTSGPFTPAPRPAGVGGEYRSGRRRRPDSLLAVHWLVGCCLALFARGLSGCSIAHAGLMGLQALACRSRVARPWR